MAPYADHLSLVSYLCSYRRESDTHSLQVARMDLQGHPASFLSTDPISKAGISGVSSLEAKIKGLEEELARAKGKIVLLEVRIIELEAKVDLQTAI